MKEFKEEDGNYTENARKQLRALVEALSLRKTT
jgi:hypothetical protein